jgi:FkbM family methyltransferase
MLHTSRAVQGTNQPTAGRMRLTRLVFMYTPLRLRPLRERYLRLQRARRRKRRLAAEARGDDGLSRPALHDMERKLDRHLARADGFFVEAGANDGFEQSNTYWLERFRGWNGVLVEPIPELYREAVLERPRARVFNCALVPFDHRGGPVTMRYGGLMSIIAGTRGSEAADEDYVRPAFSLGMESEYAVEVPARTLSSILDEVEAPEVDLLSLDVEGFEADVLRGLDLDRHAPRFVLVEIQDIENGRAAIEDVLRDRYEAVEQLSPIDLLYRRR